MKLLMENWRGYLNEIGEGTLESYDYVPPKMYDKYGEEVLRDGDIVKYEFTTDLPPRGLGLEYTVKFSRGIGRSPYLPRWEIEYYYDDDDDESLGETGEGQPLKIMSTVVKIVKDFISKPKLNQGLKTYDFEGVPKDTGDDWHETTRTRLYMRYLKKHMPPGTVVKQDGDNIRFTLPEDRKTK